MKPQRTKPQRLRSDGGSVMVEFALFLPIVVIFVLGILEYGLAWQESTELERAVAATGRVDTTLADDSDADRQALLTLSSAMSASNLTIEKVAIYEASSAGDVVPAACRNASTVGPPPYGNVAAKCNVYTAAQVANPTTAGFPRVANGSPPPALLCHSTAWDALWCPTGRDRTQPTPDYVGIWIQAKYTPLTGLIPGSDMTIERSIVFGIEPKRFEG